MLRLISIPEFQDVSALASVDTNGEGELLRLHIRRQPALTATVQSDYWAFSAKLKQSWERQLSWLRQQFNKGEGRRFSYVTLQTALRVTRFSSAAGELVGHGVLPTIAPLDRVVDVGVILPSSASASIGLPNSNQPCAT